MAKFDKEFDKDFNNDYIPTEYLTSGCHKAEILDAYFVKSPKGAEAVTLILQLNGSKEQLITTYFTNRQGEITYKDKQGDKKPMPGYIVLNEFALLVSKGKKSLQDFYTTAKKAIHVIDEWNDKKERYMPTEKKLLTPKKFIGWEGYVLLEVERSFAFKNGKEDRSNYRDSPVIRAFLDDKKFSYNEISQKADKPSYQKKWLKLYEGVLRDKTNGAFDKKDDAKDDTDDNF